MFIDGNYVYHMYPSTGYIYVFDKYTGEPSKEHSSFTYQGEQRAGYRKSMNDFSTMFIQNNEVNTNYSYYNIYICGYGLNNSIKRIQSIISVETTNKTIKQISWKEVF